ncbi:site-specific DNA-methyltransferase [Adlercreutzia sp. R25]|uniref:DNA-methyltransferase n=1 Tax=Adlercreutzia shanghongiae TaxID=3111773 RepID=UPI002DBD663B|nr:site-specific DNA-methyltransferase [Adlercreutzia sp. R25]MEC4272924.1 site-specific DNA-methyltransferase [Adlercreutzia sp. R25]
MRPRLFMGDCLDIIADLPGHSVDMVLCDPPYGCTRNKWDCAVDLGALWDGLLRVTRPGAAVVMFGSGMFTSDLMQSNRKMWRYNLVWRKTNPTGFLNARRQPLRAHEDIVVFCDRQTAYNPVMTKGPRKVSSAEHRRNSRLSDNYGAYEPSGYDSDERYPTSVLTFPRDTQRSPLHPTQKPVALLEMLVRMYSDEEATVLDCFMGSGSTGVACARTGRGFVGIEVDEGYYEVARERIEAECSDT